MKGDRFVFSTNIVSRGGKPLTRDARTKPPCGYCPKGSPEQAKQSELTFKNLQAIEFYHRVQATHGAVLTDEDKRDDLLMAKLAAIGRLFDAHKQTIAIQAGTLANAASLTK